MKLSKKQILYSAITIFLISFMFVRGCDWKHNKSHKSIQMVEALEVDNIIPIVILGSGPAGLTGAIYSVWLNIKTLVIDGPARGGLLMETTHVENWPGNSSILGPDIIKNLRDQVLGINEKVSTKQLNLVEFLDDTVTTIDFSRWPYELHTEKGKSIRAMTIILAMGASPKFLGVPGEREFWKRGVTTCAICDGGRFIGEDVAVPGGGNTAAEEAMQLARHAKTVTVLVRKDKMRAAPSMQDRLKEFPNIKIMYNVEVKKVVGNDAGVTGLELYNNKTKETSHLPVTGVFLAIGHTPNSAIVKDALETDSEGYVLVKNRTQQTSLPGVFAAGEIEDKLYRQAGVASGNGIKAALDAISFLNEIGFNPEVAKKLQSRYFKAPIENVSDEDLAIVKTQDDYDDEVKNSKGVVVVDFYKDNCPQCEVLAPTFAKVAKEFEGKAKFVKVDAMPLIDTARSLSIKTLPTIIIFNKGVFAARYQGALPEKELISLVNKVLGGE